MIQKQDIISIYFVKMCIRDRDLVPENLNSVDAIEKLVKELVEE